MKKNYIMVMTSFLLFIVTGLSTINESQKEETVDVTAVGDNLIHPAVYRDAEKADGSYNFKPMYKPVKEDIKQADLAYVNQESPLGGDDRPYSGFKRFNTPSDVAGDLVDTGFNLVNGSNNHALDQGSKGLEHEVDVWKAFKNRVLFTGKYQSQSQRDRIPVKKVNGMEVSMLSYTYGTNGLKSKHDYSINYLDKKLMKHDIQRAKKKSDAVIVSVHWGKEGSHKPTRVQKDYAKFLAKQNVDVVIGTHPHVIQPVKWVKGTDGHRTLVAYSLGNFLNAQMTGTESNELGGNLSFTLKEKGNQVTVKNVEWKSLVNHFERKDVRYPMKRTDFKVIPLDDYTDDMIQRHGLQGFPDYDMSRDRFEQITRDTIDAKYLNDESM